MITQQVTFLTKDLDSNEEYQFTGIRQICRKQREAEKEAAFFGWEGEISPWLISGSE